VNFKYTEQGGCLRIFAEVEEIFQWRFFKLTKSKDFAGSLPSDGHQLQR
jgi:hypothetical protein